MKNNNCRKSLIASYNKLPIAKRVAIRDAIKANKTLLDQAAARQVLQEAEQKFGLIMILAILFSSSISTLMFYGWLLKRANQNFFHCICSRIRALSNFSTFQRAPKKG